MYFLTIKRNVVQIVSPVEIVMVCKIFFAVESFVSNRGRSNFSVVINEVFDWNSYSVCSNLLQGL
jgi:hypothetical protein